MSELLPCPFCGDDAAVDMTVNKVRYWVCCPNCDAQGPWEHTRDAAIDSWNRRANPAPEVDRG